MTDQIRISLAVFAVLVGSITFMIWLNNVATTKNARLILVEVSEEYPYSRKYLQPLFEKNPRFLARSSKEEIMNYVARQVESDVNSTPSESWSDSTFLRYLQKHFNDVGIFRVICESDDVSYKLSLCTKNIGTIGNIKSANLGIKSYWTSRKTDEAWELVAPRYADNANKLWTPKYLSSGKTIAKTAWVREFNRRQLGKNYTVEGTTSTYSAAVLTERKARYIAVCNYAPYTVITALSVPVESDIIELKAIFKTASTSNDRTDRRLSGWHISEPGECKEVYVGRFAEAPKGVGIYSKRNGGKPKLTTYLNSVAEYATYWEGDRATWGGNDFFACVSHEALDRIVNKSESNCSNNEDLANFYNVDIPENGEFTWHVLDDAICLNTPNVDCDAITPAHAAGYAKSLSNSLERQSIAYSWWRGGNSPYILGVTLNDSNGIFEPGVLVKELTYGSTTPFGNGILVMPGDVIVSFNGTSVFSIKDLQYALYQFGQNRSGGGVNKVFGYKVKRGDSYFYLEGTYFFNPNYQWGGNVCSAAWKGLVSSATIGLDAEVLCAAPNMLTGLANVLSGFAAGLSGEDSYETYAYSDYEECVFQAKQEKWRLKQFCAVEYENAALFGLLVSAPRAIAQSTLKRSLPKIAGSKTTARVFRDILIESSEAAAWVYVDMPVGATKMETFAEMKKGAKLGAAIGVATALIGSGKRR